MDRATALTSPLRCWRAVVSRLLIILESSRLMYFKLAMAERSKKSRQGRLKYVTADESAAGTCLHPANRIIRRGNQWASWQVCTQCQARIAYASRPRAKGKARAKAVTQPSPETVGPVTEEIPPTSRASGSRASRRAPSPEMIPAPSSAMSPDLQNMMQVFLMGIQQQSADMNRAMDQINSSLRELARGQSQMLVMNEASSSSSGGHTLQQQAEHLARVAMDVDLPEVSQDEWDEVNPNAEDFGSP